MLLILLAVLLALAATLYLNRRAAARELLVGWLDRKGIDADVEVERLELNGFVGKVSIGDPKDPDFRVERVEVDYAVGMPWSKAGLGVTPSRVRMVRPIVRASWKEGKLSLGSLDPLIEEFTGKPPKPDSRAPLIIIEKGQARLDTEYGPLRLSADARLDDGRLLRLSARMPGAALKSGDVEARVLGGTLEATTTGDRVAVELKMTADSVAAAPGRGEGVALHLKGALPYPDAKAQRSDGAAALTGRFTADRVRGDTAGGDIQALSADLGFDGRIEGWLNRFSLSGQTRARVAADRLSSTDLEARALNLSLPNAALTVTGGAEADEARWRLTGPMKMSVGAGRSGEARLDGVRVETAMLRAGGHDAAFEIQAPLTLQAGALRTPDLSLRGARGEVNLDVVRDGVTRIEAQGGLRADHVALTALGAPVADDLPEMAALKRSLSDFALNAPRVRLISHNAGLELTLPQPITVRPANGGELRLQAHGRPLFASNGGRGGGAASLISTRGGGLPDARFEGIDWRLTPGGFAARLKGRAALDFGPARNIAFSTDGELAANGGRLTYGTNSCIPLSVERLDLGENAFEALSGKVCPTSAPLFVSQGGVWRAQARLLETAATAPSFEIALSDVEGALTLDGAAKGLGMRIGVDKVTVTDTADPARFMPVQATGEAKLSDDIWTAGFDLSRLGHAIGRVDVRHDGRVEAGGAVISAPNLTFTEHGLQPDDLSPLVADYVKSPVEGSAGFEGRFDWTAGTLTSSGVLNVPDLDFTSPAGKVQGLKGQVEFTSLTPLITAPDQMLTVDRVQTVTPLTDMRLSFGLDEKALTIGGGEIKAAGGRISIEPLSLPLTPGEGWGGVVVVEGVQLNELLKSANLQDKAEFDAVVSGRLPFTYDPKNGWRIVGGVLSGVRPGRLSIQPEVFDDLAAGGGGDANVPPNTMQDLAYQAMQDLAISDLTAEVNSLDGGRLGVRFRINGRHDPPQREELRLTFMELIRRDFLNKKLNLPSDTPIDLTLDTSWNANQIVSDLLEYARRGETPVLTTDETP